MKPRKNSKNPEPPTARTSLIARIKKKEVFFEGGKSPKGSKAVFFNHGSKNHYYRRIILLK
jgi:hypothetical protein